VARTCRPGSGRARHAHRCYPGSLGEFAYRELTADAEFGYRIEGDSLMAPLATEILQHVVRGAEQPNNF
jgi:hypothetical protein